MTIESERRNRLCVAESNEHLQDFLEKLFEHCYGENALHRIDFASSFDDALVRLRRWKKKADKCIMLEFHERKYKALFDVIQLCTDELQKANAIKSGKEDNLPSSAEDLAKRIIETLNMKGYLEP
tara:strand:- start:16450 stop:16824 length:375 start_codon:yes stop_codon:yes gene_type:complete